APSVVGALSVFYSLMSAGLFVPVLGGLLWRRAGAGAGLAAVVAGAGGMLVARYGVAPGVLPLWCPPSLVGIVASAVAYLLVGLLGTRNGKTDRTRSTARTA
nr:hypothetical protein [Gemmatimonadaceae bacterium]